MAEPIKEQILDNLKTALEAITTDNGYYNTLAKVERWEQDGNDKESIPCLFIHTGNESPENHPSMTSWRTLTVHLELWTIHDKTVFADSTDELLNRFSCDIETAVMADDQRGGLALSTDVANIDLFETVEGQPFCGVIVTLEIKYKHKVGDPKTQL